MNFSTWCVSFWSCRRGCGIRTGWLKSHLHHDHTLRPEGRSCSNHSWFTNQIGICKPICLLQECKQCNICKTNQLGQNKEWCVIYFIQKLTKTPIETAVGCFCTACDRSYSKFKWNSNGKPCTLSVCFFVFVWTLHNTTQGRFPPKTFLSIIMRQSKKKFDRWEQIQCLVTTEVTFVQHSSTVTAFHSGCLSSDAKRTD